MWVFTVHYTRVSIFFEGSAASFAEPMPMQIAQDKCLSISKIHCQGRLTNQFCNKVCPMDILSDPEPVYQKTSGGVNS